MLFFILFSFIIFFLGIVGIFIFRKHFINILVSLELILLAINLNFVIFSFYLDDILGQIYCLIVLTVAAAESSIGLALLIIYYRLRGGISIDLINLLKS
jgi:NADH:ubiquinone oxidoreductase subunit K